MLRRTEKSDSIQREDAVIDTTPVVGNLIKIKKPEMISLVGRPANETAFKAIREDSDGKPAIIRRTRRADPAPVLRLTFPEGTDETTVTEALTLYGLSSYKVEANATGVYTATRADLKSISELPTMEIKLSNDGLVATVVRQEATAAPKEKDSIEMAHIEFDTTKFSLEEVQRWTKEKSVDGKVEEPQNAGECYVVRRSEVAKEAETRRMKLEDGVTAVIVRSHMLNVPDGFIAVVNETAYGSWGWGQLDFTASMADVEFSEQMTEAVDLLSDILRTILYWSPLPLDVRKQLANNALTQFGTYIGTIMDSLPRQLLASVVRSATPSNLENLMTKAVTSGSEPTSASDTTVVTTTTATTTGTPEAPITRADIASMIAEGIATAMKANAPASTVAVVETPAGPLTRSDMTSLFADAVKPFTERLTALEGKTIVRAAEEQQVVKQEPANTKATPEKVFRGVFGDFKNIKK